MQLSRLAILGTLGAIVLASAGVAEARSVSRLTSTGAPFGATTIEVSQIGPDLRLSIKTAKPIVGRKLSAGAGPYVCARLAPPKASAALVIVCPVESSRTHSPSLRAYKIARDGTKLGAAPLPANVRTSGQDLISAVLTPGAAKLPKGRLTLSALASGAPACNRTPPEACFASALTGSGASFSVKTAQLVGCRPGGPSFRTNGPPTNRRVSLTFDDGPWATTPQVLNILRKFHVNATFFQIGRQVPGNDALEHRILREGNELGDHTYAHNFRGAGDLRATNDAIRRASGGYTPCLFRAPGGAASGGIIATARSLNMLTIQWNVDPRDWATPGTGSIISNVLGNIRPGSIVVMHDGGGNRSQTVAALPVILRSLRSRGLHQVPVSQLLGLHPRWRYR